MEIAAGFLIALAIGLTGLGAGTMTAPVLLLFFGCSGTEAVTIALVFGTVVKMLAAPVYIWRREVDWRVLGSLLLGGLPGVLVGSLVLQHLNHKAVTGPVLLIVGLTVLVSATMNLWRGWRQGVVPAGHTHYRLLPWVMAPIGLEVGFSSAGAGALGTLALMRWTTLRPAAIVGTDMLFGLGLSLVGGSLHVGLNGVNGLLLGKLLLGGVPAAIIGAQIAGYVPAHKLRLGLCVWLAYLGGQLVYKSVGSF